MFFTKTCKRFTLVFLNSSLRLQRQGFPYWFIPLIIGRRWRRRTAQRQRYFSSTVCSPIGLVHPRHTVLIATPREKGRHVCFTYKNGRHRCALWTRKRWLRATTQVRNLDQLLHDERRGSTATVHGGSCPSDHPSRTRTEQYRRGRIHTPRGRARRQGIQIGKTVMAGTDKYIRFSPRYGTAAYYISSTVLK